jgi:curved DNA-binding protein
MKYHDYHETLGVPRTASQDDIRKAFRRLARRYHPDRSKEKDADKRFKEINEANDVLGDPEKRRRYDQLGANWRAGQEFSPPPGWENVRFDFGGSEAGGGSFGFSDFFESLFGGGSRRQGANPFEAFAGFGGKGRGRQAVWPPQRGQDVEAELAITLEESLHGARKEFELRHGDGSSGAKPRRIEVRIPPGSRDGDRLRLAGQGDAGGKAPAGDLYIRLRVLPHPRFSVEGDNLRVATPVAPWEAALGAKIPLRTLDGTVTLTIPPGTPSGRTLRLRGQGLPQRGGGRGDLLAEVRIEVPQTLTPRERELFEELSRVSPFRPER